MQPCQKTPAFAVCCEQESATERRTCQDVAFVAAACLVAGSRWNQSAGPRACLFRISEVQPKYYM